MVRQVFVQGIHGMKMDGVGPRGTEMSLLIDRKLRSAPQGNRSHL